MNQFDSAGFFRHGLYPLYQIILVGVGRISGQGMDSGTDEDSFAIQIYIASRPLAVLNNIPSWCTTGLVAYKEDVIFGVFESGF